MAGFTDDALDATDDTPMYGVPKLHLHHSICPVFSDKQFICKQYHRLY